MEWDWRMRGDIKSFKLLSSLPGCRLREPCPGPWYKAACKPPGPSPQLWTRQGSPSRGGAERARGRKGGLGNGETNSIFCLAVEGGLLWPTGSPSEAISDGDECLVFPGAEAAKPRKPSVSLPLISCLGKCSVRRQRK